MICPSDPSPVSHDPAKAERVTRVKARAIMRTLGLYRAARYLAARGVECDVARYWLLTFREVR